MPTSSTSSRQSRTAGPAATTTANQAADSGHSIRYWPSATPTEPTTTTKTPQPLNIRRQSPHNNFKTTTIINKTNPSSHHHKLLSKRQAPSGSNKLAGNQIKHNKINHISPPTSLTSTSVALRNSMLALGPADRCELAAASSRDIMADVNHQHQPTSLVAGLAASVADFAPANESANRKQEAAGRGGHFAFLAGKSFHIGQPGQKSSGQQSQSQQSLMSQSVGGGLSSLSVNSSNQMLNGNQQQQQQQQQQRPLQIGRRMDLKYVKSFIIILMAADLLITVLVHQFAQNDELSAANLSLTWLRSIKVRLSLINLLLSSVWFIILTGGILFDVYSILFVSLLLDVASFLLLLCLSVVHFTRRIDYQTVQLTSLLALLFSVVVLHVYLLVLAALTLYLMLAVRRRQRVRAQQP